MHGDANDIASQGFRKWYERELVRGHLHLLLVVLCALALIGALEAFGQQHGSGRMLMAASAAVATALGAWALRRYLYHLMRAESVAHQAVCPQCQVYAQWQVDTAPGSAAAGRLPVRCRRCGHRWSIGG